MPKQCVSTILCNSARGNGMLHILEHVLHHAFEDSIKIFPFLFVTYLVMEYLEEKMNAKTIEVLQKSEKSGPIWGALLGMLPQCGFSASASNLYAGRMITVGTLLAVYLSTSDEMLPMMISASVEPGFIIKVVLLKAGIGMLAGCIIDYVWQKLLKHPVKEPDIHHFCEHEHCECGHGIVRPAIRHTLQIWVFIYIVTVVLGFIIEVVGTDALSNFILNKPFIGEILAGIIGLIPNCAASVVITQLFLDGLIPFGTMMAGLLVGAGVGVLILLRVNEERKDTFKIIGLLYVIGVVAGMIINLVS